jgi:hypothetical protein
VRIASTNQVKRGDLCAVHIEAATFDAIESIHADHVAIAAADFNPGDYGEWDGVETHRTLIQKVSHP